MKTRLFVLCLILALSLIVIVGSSSASIDPPSFSLVLTFTGASSSSCGTGGYIAFSAPVTFGGGFDHTQEATVTDGAGNVLFSQSGPNFIDGTYSSYSSFTFGVAPVRNPITATIVYDGVTYTGSANNPCFVPIAIEEPEILVFEGPAIPEGFVLKRIICDVAVYDTPSGSPVGANKLTIGQTWFVNPIPIEAANGELWSEVFVSGYINGFVPTRCVN